MIHNYYELHRSLSPGAQYTVSIAAAHDRSVMETVREMYDSGLAKAILVGDQEQIEQLCGELHIAPRPEIIPAADEQEAARIAASLVRGKRADILMKGLVNSSVFLKAVLNPEYGIRGDSLLSHLAAFEIPGAEKLAFHTDGGMNICPDLDQKKAIVINAVRALRAMGITEPKVAVLAANEQVNPKMPTTVDAAALQKMNEEGLINGCIIEGPISMDVALSSEAAAHKHLKSRISGDVDLFVVPNIEAGNLVGKTLIYSAKAKMAGVILGALNPIVMTSRSDNPEGKLNSLALAIACLQKEENK